MSNPFSQVKVDRSEYDFSDVEVDLSEFEPDLTLDHQRWEMDLIRTDHNIELHEVYVVGGFHPVHLGDMYEDRYRVIRKLGHGLYSTVWLAKDESVGEYVAMKFGIACTNPSRPEADTLKKLNSVPYPIAIAPPPVTRLLDSFDVRGPNGVHNVLVLKPLACTLQEFMAERGSRWAKDESYGDVGLLRKLSSQMIDAVSHVHSKGIVHRDIVPGNIMFTLNSPLESVDEDDLNEPTRLHWHDNVFPLRRVVDGKPPNLHAPMFVLISIPLAEKISDIMPLSTSRLMLSGFGAATTFEDANDGYQTYTEAYSAAWRPPEVLLGLPVSEKSDIWALGCTIFKLVTGQDLFFVDGIAAGEQGESERRWFVDDNLRWHRLDDISGYAPHGKLIDRLPRFMSAARASAFEGFIRWILQYEPEKRPSAKEILGHPWLTDEEVPEEMTDEESTDADATEDE
ncbi:hypothetical protein MMC07_003126 [Pseudocyphellaria aurata]|nr:hypothetical protein [Pseudocyphellaria aurata]